MAKTTIANLPWEILEEILFSVTGDAFLNFLLTTQSIFKHFFPESTFWNRYWQYQMKQHLFWKSYLKVSENINPYWKFALLNDYYRVIAFNRCEMFHNLSLIDLCMKEIPAGSSNLDIIETERMLEQRKMIKICFSSRETSKKEISIVPYYSLPILPQPEMEAIMLDNVKQEYSHHINFDKVMLPEMLLDIFYSQALYSTMRLRIYRKNFRKIFVSSMSDTPNEQELHFCMFLNQLEYTPRKLFIVQKGEVISEHKIYP